MKIPVYLTIVAVVILTGCGKDSSKPAQTGAGGGPLDNRGDYLSTLAKGEISAVKTVDTAALNQAIQMFNAQEGRFPKDLDELVKSKLIGEIPAAPAGMKIVYDSTAGQVKVVRE